MIRGAIQDDTAGSPRRPTRGTTRRGAGCDGRTSPRDGHVTAPSQVPPPMFPRVTAKTKRQNYGICQIALGHGLRTSSLGFVPLPAFKWVGSVNDYQVRGRGRTNQPIHGGRAAVGHPLGCRSRLSRATAFRYQWLRHRRSAVGYPRAVGFRRSRTAAAPIADSAWIAGSRQPTAKSLIAASCSHG